MGGLEGTRRETRDREATKCRSGSNAGEQAECCTEGYGHHLHLPNHHACRFTLQEVCCNDTLPGGCGGPILAASQQSQSAMAADARNARMSSSFSALVALDWRGMAAGQNDRIRIASRSRIRRVLWS